MKDQSSSSSKNKLNLSINTSTSDIIPQSPIIQHPTTPTYDHSRTEDIFESPISSSNNSLSESSTATTTITTPTFNFNPLKKFKSMDDPLNRYISPISCLYNSENEVEELKRNKLRKDFNLNFELDVETPILKSQSLQRKPKRRKKIDLNKIQFETEGTLKLKKKIKPPSLNITPKISPKTIDMVHSPTESKISRSAPITPRKLPPRLKIEVDDAE
ncbi:unnamed protein product [Candida verbasci]|uniref:Uncharacterized protein n=1 Tax=Candida verbasci TaxID=1227364 RepID=A0A9W4TUX6_9ASCO|nr:unnamed protein product [Candida verbasci]